MVWPLPRSLATTYGITIVFFSSSYLDVSVQRVHDCFPTPSAWWVAPFGHLRIKGRLHLPAVFRSLPRPSSSPGAKASPIRSYFASISFNTKLIRSYETIYSGRSCSWLSVLFRFTFFTTPLFPSLVNELFVAFNPLSQICPAKTHPILVESHNGNTKWTRTIRHSFEPRTPNGS